MDVNGSRGRWAPALAYAAALLAALGTVALLAGRWVEGAGLLACAGVAGLGVPRDVVRCIVGTCVCIAVSWRVLCGLFGSGGAC